jgi:hypothetical protein
MSLCTVSTDTISINSILPRHSCFQESLDQFVTEFENCFGLFGRKTSAWCDDDFEGVSGREGDKDAYADFWEWE